MRWITREHVKVDRVACPWLLKKFVDPEAEFFFVPRDDVEREAERLAATPFDTPGAHLGHRGKECSFEAILKEYGLAEDPALALLAKIVNGADTDNTLWNQPEGAGLKAIAEGFQLLGFRDDHEVNAAEWIVYDALYAYCRHVVERDGVSSLPPRAGASVDVGQPEREHAGGTEAHVNRDEKTPGRTLIFTAADVDALLDDDACIAAVESAFRQHAEGRGLPPASLAVAGRHGGFHVKAAGLEIDGRLYFAAKSNGNFPGNPERSGLPTIQGVIVLCDAENGFPLAIMDSGLVTSRRTAAATAVAARHLARRDATEATVIGCGEQGYAQLRVLSRVLPLARAHLVDLSAESAHALARRCASELGLEAIVADDAAVALRTSQVCVTCTTSEKPVVWRDQVQAGTFVAGVGADNPQKHELDPRLLAAGRVVVDLLESCAVGGDLHHALDAGVMRREDVYAELADVVSGRRAGRMSEDEITIFDSTGTALQDVAAAMVVYRRGLAARRGKEIDLAPHAGWGEGRFEIERPDRE